jgi:hypothetical protein
MNIYKCLNANSVNNGFLGYTMWETHYPAQGKNAEHYLESNVHHECPIFIPIL